MPVSTLLTLLKFAGLAALASLAAASAPAGKDDARLAGLGGRPGTPIGTPWKLPPGVTVEIRGMGDEGCPVPQDATDLGQIGTGRAGMCATIENHQSTPTKIAYGDGMLIYSCEVCEDWQPGALAERFPIDITDEGGDISLCPYEKVVVSLATYCLAHKLPFPEPHVSYGKMINTSLPELNAIGDAAVNKDLSGIDSLIQGYVDDFVDGKATRAQLTELLAEIRAQPEMPKRPKRQCQPKRRT